MRVFLATLLTGTMSGFLAGLVSYLVYRRYEESHVLLQRLVYRPLGIPEEEKKFRKRSYLTLSTFAGFLYGLLFELLFFGEFLQRLEIYIYNLAFFGFSVGLSVALFQVLLHWKVERVTKQVAEQWLLIGLVFGFLMGTFFNLVSFFLVAPFLLL